MTDLKRCDRCGKIQRVMIVMNSEWLFKTTVDKSVDLCDECTVSAQKWFISGPLGNEFNYDKNNDNTWVITRK